MNKNSIVNFQGYRGTVRRLSYKDGSIALQLYTFDGEPLATATVCLSEYGCIPPEGHAYIKNYAENEGILEALIEAGAIELTGEILLVGPYGCQVHLVRVV